MISPNTPLHEVPRQPDNPTTLAEALAFYAAHGLPVTPVKAGGKDGYKTGWSKREPGTGESPSDFRLTDNVGVLNGTEPAADWYFHDVDIDANSDMARQIVERLLPPTGWRYGRTSKPRSHANYLVKGQLRTRKYLGIDKKTILELRGLTQKQTHTLSVAPGSTWVHEDKREPIRFCEPRTAIGRVENPEDLDLAVKHASIGIVIASVWPPKGNRHHLRLAFAKVLIEHLVSPDHSRDILEAVMAVTGSDVADVAPTVQSTHDAMQAGQQTAGASEIIDILGEDIGRTVLTTIAKILRSSIHTDTTDSVVMRGGALTGIVDRAETALLSTAIYQRGGLLTRAIKLDVAIGSAHDVRREAGSTMLIAVREAWLIEQMSRTLRWLKVNADGVTSPADPRPIYAHTLLGRAEWRFPVLRGVVTAPTLDRDGRIIETPGFDAASGLLVDIAPGSFPPVPTMPTKHQAEVALACLSHPLRGFPFVDGAKSVALSALLTALVRASLRTAPIHGFDAPTAGTGKSLLAEMAGLLAMGFRPPALSQGKTAEEDEKRLSTVLFAGDRVIHIDNCELPVSGDFLCSMATQEVVQARILGLSERRVLPSTALILMSGNNLTFGGDASRRAVICRLDALVERPDTRVFDFDCHAEVLASRPDLVVAGLTILRAYHIAGRPTKLQPMGSFDDYEWIRGALVWLACADPELTRRGIIENDPKKDELTTVLELWERAVGIAEIGVADIDTRALSSELDRADLDERTAMRELRDTLTEIACRGVWNSKSVGWWLRGNKDRVVDGRCLRGTPGRLGTRWCLVLVQQQSPLGEA